MTAERTVSVHRWRHLRHCPCNSSRTAEGLAAVCASRRAHRHHRNGELWSKLGKQRLRRALLFGLPFAGGGKLLDS